MKQKVLKIPKRISDNFGEPLFHFLNFLSQVNSHEKGVVTVDFSDCKFTSPVIIAGLVSITQSEKEKVRKTEFILPEHNESIRNYIDTIFFPNGLNYEKYKIEEFEEVLKFYHKKTFIPIIKFPATKEGNNNKIREKVLTAINSILKNQLNLTGNYLMAIAYMIAEFTQNIVDHSGSETGILTAQFYPTKNYMDLCIADTGKGLLKSYLDTNKHNPKSDEEAINFAVFGKSTKDIPESRGFGISTSRRMLVEGLKGKFFILSGKAFFNQNIEKQEIITMPDKYDYKGCFIALRIPIQSNTQFDFYKFVE